MISALGNLAAALPRAVDRQDSTARITGFVFVLLAVLLFPTGILTANEEYYFQVAARFWSDEPAGRFDAVQERSYHLLLSSLLIGLPVEWWGYEAANAVLRVLTALALAAGFARLAAAWGLSALDSVAVVCAFVLLDQQYFGGEWIFYSVEGKVFAYVFVFLGLASAKSGHLKSCIASLAIATWFHFLVGGFWTLVVLAWLLLERQRLRSLIGAAASWVVAVLPLAGLILWQRAASGAGDSSVDTWYAYAVLRMPHHVAPFSETMMIWNWTPRIVLLLSTLIVSIMAFQIRLEPAVRRFIVLLIGLQAYLLAALLTSATEAGVRLLGQFYVFRPSSLTLLLVIAAAFIVYRQGNHPRLIVWMAAWMLVPMAGWGVAKDKIHEVLSNPVESAVLQGMTDAVTRAAAGSELVLVQPGRDDEQPEVGLSRLLPRATLVNWQFTPTDGSGIAEWVKRQRFRVSLFTHGCRGPLEYPVGALVVYLPKKPPEHVIDSCGEVVWSGGDYSVVDVR